MKVPWVIDPFVGIPEVDDPEVLSQALELGSEASPEWMIGLERRCAVSIQMNPGWRDARNPVPFDRFEQRSIFEQVALAHWGNLTEKQLLCVPFDDVVSDLVGGSVTK